MHFAFPLADVTALSLGLFIHLLAVIVGIGSTFAYPVISAWVERFAPEAIPGVWGGMRRADHLLVTPGLVLVLLSGLYLVSEGDLSLGESWVSVGFAAVIILLGLTHGFTRPRLIKGIEISERDLKDEGALSEEFSAISRQIALGGMFASMLTLGTIFFMTVKP